MWGLAPYPTPLEAAAATKMSAAAGSEAAVTKKPEAAGSCWMLLEHANDDNKRLNKRPRGSDATERASSSEVMTTLASPHRVNDDNTGPSGSDATEHAATTEAMTTPAFDAATSVITIGPCRLLCMSNEHGLLCKMRQEIIARVRVPVTLEHLLQKYEQTPCTARKPPWHPRKATGENTSWSATIESISQCIAAFQKATDAKEHSECQDIATKTCDYAVTLTHKTPAYCGRGDLLSLVHQFMENRTYNLAFKHLLDQVFLCAHERDGTFWSHVAGSPTPCGSQREEYLRILEMCMNAIRVQADKLQRKMEVYRHW